MNYFNNEKITKLVLEYQQQEPLSEEAKRLSNIILKHTEKLIEKVIYTHKLTMFQPLDDVMSIGREAVFKSLKNFNPDKGSSVFNYFSFVVMNSIRYKSGDIYKKRLRLPEVNLDDVEIIHNDVTYDHIEKFRRNYKFLFSNSNLHPIFMVMCDFLEEDPTHTEKKYIVNYLKTRTNEFVNGFGHPIKDDKIINIYVNQILDEIRQYRVAN